MWLAVSAVWLTLAMAMLLKWLVGRICPTVGEGAVESLVTSVELVTTAGSHKDSDTANSAKPPHKSDVFINHRGPDVKRTFAAHLCAALSRAGYFPFLDTKSIKQGRSTVKSIDEALSDACVHVAIFSKRYAESKYCLDELVDMLQSGKVILPIFYDVKPEHLRRTEEGPFAEGFRKHVKRKRHDKIPKWREALRKASEIMGYENSGDESELVRSLVVAIGNNMPVILPSSKRRFGLDESVKDVLSRADMMSASVNILGLVGSGGIGKTTLASEIYNHFVSRRQFQHHCFLKDVRSSDVFELRRQLVRDLIQVDLQSKSSAEYYRKLGVFNSQRVLLIVDDIDDETQFADLIPDINQLGSGSGIIIASRDRAVLDFTMREASSKVIYEVQLLNSTHSQLLFNWNAFYNEIPSPGFGDLAEKVVEACGGHPLALEVIGASLYGKKDREIWMDAVKTLGEDKTIHKKLRISYDALPSPGDQAMFRDIACLLIGMPDYVAMTIWKSCQSCSDFCCTPKAPHLTLRRLLDRSLVKLDSGRLSMHDIIRDMGREVVRKELPKVEERTHLWDTATAVKVLSKNKGSGRIRGIRLCTRDTDGTLTSKASQLATMDELHLLVLDGYLIEPDDFSRWSQELRWLQWKSLPYMELPYQFNLSKLAVLDLTDSGNLSHLWKHGARIQFPFLQILVLTNCRALEELPLNLGQSVPRLKTMEMENCVSMALLPDSLGELKLLEHLILSDCEKLEALPDTLVNLVKLQNLILDGCIKLRHLPTSMGGLRMLKKLHMSKSPVGGLRMLTELHMSMCPVQDLPEDFGQLTSLDFLSIDMLRSVPKSFQRLESLTFLLVEEAPDRGGWLASSLEALTALKTLHLCNNPTIITLPEGFGNMKTLRHLQIANASALVTIEVLPQSLQFLEIRNCLQLVNIPSLRELSSLTLLNLCNCSNLRQIDGLEYLTALEDINLSGVASLSDCLSVLHRGSYRALRNCCLSGSKVAVAYDNRWKEEKPALQLITYYDNSIGYFPNGMAQECLDQGWSFEYLTGATILSQAKCLALIFCFVAHDQGWSDYVKEHGSYNSNCGMVLQIMREGKVVTETGLLSLRHADERNQVYLWTLRGEHPVVQLLQLGDKVCIYARSKYPGWHITVREGAICVVHAEDEHLSLAINSKQLNRNHSEIFSAKLGGLVLTDDFHLTLKPELEVGSTFGELLASDEESLSQQAANSNVKFDKPPQQGWLIAPAYGHFDWNLSWKLPREGQGCISFEARARDSIYVAISEHCNDSQRSRMYEIIIGGLRNTTSVIQKHHGNEQDVFICCSVAAGLMHPEGINRLWVSIDKRTSMIQVGRGEPAQDVIAVYQDTRFFSKAQNVSFTSMDSPVAYSNAVITDAVEHLPPLLYTYRLSETTLQSVVNGKWAMTANYYGHYTWAQHWMLPRAGRGILSFLAESASCNDIYVAISSHPYTMDPMYDIIIAGWSGSATAIRRQSQGPFVCKVTNNRDTFDPDMNQFWVLIDDRTGLIQVGQGEPLHDMFLIYKDAAFLSEAQYCTFTTWGNPVTYSSVEITAILD